MVQSSIMKTPFFPRLTGLVALFLGVSSLQAQVTHLRMQPRISETGLFAGRESLAVGGGRVAMGVTAAVKPNSGGLNTGGVDVFDLATGKHLRSIFPADGTAGMLFGDDIAISGNVLIVGAPGAPKGLDPDVGAIYLYNLSTGRLIRKIQDNTWAAGDAWGDAVAADADLMVASGPMNDTGSTNGGMVWSWSITTGNVIAQVMVGTTGDGLGNALALDGALVAIGASGAGGGTGEIHLRDALTGAAYSTLTDPSPLAGGQFGRHLALRHGRLLAGAPLDLRGGAGAGRVVCYAVSTPSSPAFYFAEDGTQTGENLGAGLAIAPRLDFFGSPGANAFSVASGQIRARDPVTGDDVFNLGSIVLPDDRLGRLLRFQNGVLIASAPGDDHGNTGANLGALWKIEPFLLRFSDVGTRSAVTKETPPGVPNTTFSDFTELSLAHTGFRPAFVGRLTGADSTQGRNTGIWEQFSGTVTFSQRTGVPNVIGSTFRTIGNLRHPATNYVLFSALKTDGRQGLFYYDVGGFGFVELVSTGLTTVFITGNEVPQTFYNYRAAHTVAEFALPMKLKAGSGNTPVTAASDAAVFPYPNALIREGVTTAPGGLGTYGHIPPRAAQADAQVILTAFSQSSPPRQFVARNGTLVAKSPDMALGTGFPGAPFRSFLGETAITGTGPHSLVRATLSLSPPSVTSASNEGLWADRGAGLELILRKGQPIPGAGILKRFLDYAIDKDGVVLALVQLGGSGVTTRNDLAVVRQATSGTTVEMREGSAVPGSEGARIGTIQAIDMPFGPTSSFYGILCTLVVESGGATSRDNLAWFTADTSAGAINERALRTPTLRLRKGERYIAPGGEDRFVTFSSPKNLRDATGAGNTGLSHILSSNGTLTTVVTYPDKRRALITK